MWRLQLLLVEHGWRLVLVAGIALLFAEAALFGGVKASTGLTFAALLSAWAAVVALVLPGPVPFLSRPSLVVATLASLLLAGWSLFTLVPAPLDWAAPVWTAVGAQPVITYDRAATLRELVKLASIGALFIAGLTIGRDRKQSRFFLRVLAIGTIAYGLWAVISFWIDPDLLLGAPKRFHQDRLTASFYSANTAGSLFGALGVMFLVLAAEDGVNQVKKTPEFGVVTMKGPSFSLVLYAFAGVLCLGALMLTGSRFAIVASAAGLAVGVFLISILAGVRAWIAGLVSVVALALAVALPILSNAGAARRAWNLGDTVSDRLGSLEALVAVGQSRPWQGHGLGTFRQAVAPSIDSGNLRLLWDLGAAHNLGVQWFIEAGAIGAGLACIVLLAVLASLWPFPLKRSRPGRGRLIAVISLSLALILHNLVDYSLQVPVVAGLFALILGLAAAATLQSEQ